MYGDKKTAAIKLSHLSLTDIDEPLDTQPPEDALRYLFDKKNMKIGTAVSTWSFPDNPRYGQIVAEFNQLIPEGAFGMGVIHPAIGVYDFSAADNEVNFAIRNGMEPIGDMSWGKDISYLRSLPRDQAINEFKDHVKKLAEHFKGKIKKWRFNEYGFEDALLTKIGENYLDIGIQALLDVDKNASIILNYFANIVAGQGREVVSQRTDAIFNVALKLKEKYPDAHISLGNQGHLYKGVSASIQNLLVQDMSRCADSDIQYEFTEVDDTEANLQATTFSEMARAALEVNTKYGRNVCLGITTWGPDGGHSWLRRPEFRMLGGAGPNVEPVLFNQSYERQQSWYALQKIFS